MSPPAAYTCSKTFSGFPCTHRQWRNPGHCRFVHGYSRSFRFWFQATSLDEHGFVVDFSSLRPLQQRLAEQFDHTFLANADDPLLATWQALHDQGALDLRVMTNVGMEASAQLVWSWANELLQAREGGRSCCFRVEARENEKNSASFAAIPAWFSGATGESPVDGSSDDAWPQAAYRETVDDEPAAADGENGRDSGGEPAGRGGIWEAP
jgi:6-pyruvoyltetrahydropterin/6-carboxytetrahydropterin synthase